MVFDQIEPWRENEPFVEIQQGDRVLDLHNWASFLGFEYGLPESVVLRFDLDETEGAFRPGAPSKKISLRFDGVAGLGVHREQLEHVYEPETLDGLMYRQVRPGVGLVRCTMMDGFTIIFEARSVALEEAL